MAEQILPWVGLGGLFLLCLPLRFLQKLVLEVSVWALRLGMIALLAGGAYLWFSPADLPASVSAVLNDFPGLLSALPARGSAPFALTAACLIVAALVPILTALDVARRRCRDYAPAPVTVVEVAAPSPAKPKRVKRPEPEAEATTPDVATPNADRTEVIPAVMVEPIADATEVIEEGIPIGVPILRPIERRDAADAITSAATRPPVRPAE